MNGLRPREGDAAAAIFGIEQGGTDWFSLGLGLALALHLAMLGFAVRSSLLHETSSLMKETRTWLHDFFWTTYDVEPEKKPPPPPKVEAPPEPPAPEPVAVAPPKAVKLKDDPYEPPPPPAQAAKVLTQKEDPDKIEDLTGNTVVSGEGNALGGMQSASGKGDKQVFNPAASLTGTPGGRGTAPAPPPPPPPPTGPDLSRAAAPTGSSNWNCPFPAEAQADQIDEARVSVAVTVRPDGTALSVSVISDPGHGFGRAARMCALGRRFNPAFDRTGAAITATTPPFIVHFNAQ